MCFIVNKAVLWVNPQLTSSVEAEVPCQGNPCGICDGQRGTTNTFLSKYLAFHSSFNSGPYISLIYQSPY